MNAVSLKRQACAVYDCIHEVNFKHNDWGAAWGSTWCSCSAWAIQHIWDWFCLPSTSSSLTAQIPVRALSEFRDNPSSLIHHPTFLLQREKMSTSVIDVLYMCFCCFWWVRRRSVLSIPNFFKEIKGKKKYLHIFSGFGTKTPNEKFIWR